MALKFFVTLLFTLFCSICSAKNLFGITLSCDTMKYFIRNEKIITYNINLTNQSNNTFYIWFNKDTSHNETEKEQILKHFLTRDGAYSSSLFEIGMECDITIIHEIFSTFTVKLSPGKQFTIQLLQEGYNNNDKDFNIVEYLRNLLVICDEEVICKQLEGIKAFSPNIFYSGNSIILPIQKIKQ